MPLTHLSYRLIKWDSQSLQWLGHGNCLIVCAVISLLSLDHDLDPLFKRDGMLVDPGDGRDVARFLATQRPVCPIILHSTNGEMAREMEEQLSSAGCGCIRVVPFAGMGWITSTWLSVVRTKL